MITNSIAVVMTATIKPFVKVVRIDPEVRVLDYKAGLQFWLNLPDTRIRNIIFIENSGYPLDEIRLTTSKNPYKRNCEFISLSENELPEGLHYGFSEFRLMDHGLDQSKLYCQSDVFLKATGRYIFPKITRLLNALPEKCVFAADTRNNSFLTNPPVQIIACPLLYFTKEFYNEHIRTLYTEMEPAPPWGRKQFMEDMLFDRLMPMRNQPNVVLRWPVNCDQLGVGANNDSYNTMRKKMISTARALGRRLTPNWWF